MMLLGLCTETQHSTAQHDTVRTVQYSTAQHSTVPDLPHFTVPVGVQYSTVQYSDSDSHLL
jgi:hypothetical protein